MLPLRYAATQCFALLGADKPAVVANNAHSALSPFPRDSKVTPSATLVPVRQLLFPLCFTFPMCLLLDFLGGGPAYYYAPTRILTSSEQESTFLRAGEYAPGYQSIALLVTKKGLRWSWVFYQLPS